MRQRTHRTRARAPRAVLFDLDDTIFDHALTCRDALRRLRQDRRWLAGRSTAAVWSEYQRLLDRTYRRVLSGRSTPDEERRRRFRRLARFCGTTIGVAEAEATSAEYRAYYHELRRPVPGARGLIERLRDGSVVGIVSNGPVAEQEEKLEFLGLDRLVDLRVISEEVGAAKPDPRIFEVALDRAGAPACETVMVGDSWANDVRGARKVGIGAVWFNRFRLAAPEQLGVPELGSFRVPRQVEQVLARAVGSVPPR